MEKDFSLKRSAIKIAAGLGTFAMLAGCDKLPDRKPDVVECNYETQRSVTLEIPDGKFERVSTLPTVLDIRSLKDGSLAISKGSVDLPVVLIDNVQKYPDDYGIFVPGDTVTIRDSYKGHTITKKGRGADNTSSMVEVNGACLRKE